MVTAITIRKSATDPLEVNHLCPLITHSSPSRTAEVVSSVGSDPAVLGSVMENADRRSPIQQRLQPPLPLCFVTGLLDTHRQQLRVPRIRRIVAEHHRRQRRLAQDLVHQAQPHLPEPHPAQRRRQVRRPQPLGLDPLLQRPHGNPHLVIGQIQGLEREHLLAHEAGASIPTSLRTRARSRNPRPWPLLSALRPTSGGPHPATTVGAVTTTSPVAFRHGRVDRRQTLLIRRARRPAQVALSAADRAVIAAAEHALLDERRLLAADELAALAALPDGAVMALASLAHQVRLAWCGPEVEIEGILSAKTGGCPEDCHFCAQWSRFDTPVKATPFLDTDEVLAAARETAALGASEFCIVLAVRGPDERTLQRILELVPGSTTRPA